MDGAGGDLGLKVRITPIIDQGKLSGEAKKVEKQINKTMPKDGGGILGRLGGFANKMGMGGGVGSAAIAGAVGGIIASVMNVVMGMLKKVFSVMVESSGSLRNVLKLLNMGFLQIIRPFADVLAIMLRPIAMFFRIVGREVMKRVREKRKELKAQGYSGIALGGALMAELPSIYLDVLMEQLGKIDWGTFFSKILSVLWENLTVRLPAFLGKVFEILNGLGKWIWENIILAIGNLALTELAKFGWWLWTEITEAIGDMAIAIGTFGVWLWTEITDGIGNLGSALSGFGNWLWKSITQGIGNVGSILGGFGDWVYKVLTGAITLPQALLDIGTTFYDMFVKVYNGFADFANMFSLFTGITVQKVLTSAEKNAWSNASHKSEKDRFYANNPQFKSMAVGGLMTSDGLIYAHAGEAVIGTDSLRGMIADAISVNNSNTILIPGSVIADAIDRRVDYYYKYKVANRR